VDDGSDGTSSERCWSQRLARRHAVQTDVIDRGPAATTCYTASPESSEQRPNGLPCRSGIPPYQTCLRRYQRWAHTAVFERNLEAPAIDLKNGGKLDLSECFNDGTVSAPTRARLRRRGQAGHGCETHGNGKPRWLSSRRLCRFGFAS
jgi:hypothetical protein